MRWGRSGRGGRIAAARASISGLGDEEGPYESSEALTKPLQPYGELRGAADRGGWRPGLQLLVHGLYIALQLQAQSQRGLYAGRGFYRWDRGGRWGS